jgi:hypothetical protein
MVIALRCGGRESCGPITTTSAGRLRVDSFTPRTSATRRPIRLSTAVADAFSGPEAHRDTSSRSAAIGVVGTSGEQIALWTIEAYRRAVIEDQTKFAAPSIRRATTAGDGSGIAAPILMLLGGRDGYAGGRVPRCASGSSRRA